MKKRLALFIATGLFVGYFPFAPGTIGTLLGVFIYWVSPGYLLLSLPLFFLLSLWSIKQASSLLLKEDDPKIVIDETTGFLVTMLFLPPNWEYILAGFILFRIIDILKPYPINKIEEISSPWGVVLDDVAAGAMSCLLLHGFRYIFG